MRRTPWGVVAVACLILACWTAAEAQFTKALCRRPPNGCAALRGDPSECSSWSGCQVTGVDGQCINKNNCDQLRCELHLMTANFSSRILPGCVRGDQAQCDLELKHVSDSLELQTKCALSEPFRSVATRTQDDHVVSVVGESSLTWFVSPTGMDINSGKSRSSPLNSIDEALRKAREAGSSEMKTIVLMAGRHRLLTPVLLTSADSNTVFQGETGAIVTGSIPVSVFGIQWNETKPGEYETFLPLNAPELTTKFSTIFYQNEPMVRARYPNVARYTETSWVPGNGIRTWQPRTNSKPYSNIIRRVIEPGRRRYRTFVRGQNGACADVFTPPIGYFCDPKYDADLNCPFSRVGAVTFNAGAWTQINGQQWSNPKHVYFHALHRLKWGGWTYQVNSVEGMKVNLGDGGFQEGRGDCGKGGADWFVEGAQELLDAPNEFFYDSETGLIRLKLDPSAVFDPNAVEIGVNLTNLITARGQSSDDAIQGLHFRNIRFERTSSIHMLPHEMPSGGDWSLHRAGALFIENARDVSVTDCFFTQLGSHAAFFSNHIKQVSIERNTFYGLEASAIMLVGDPKYYSATPWNRVNDVDHVEDVVIRYNKVSDVGLMVVQSAAVFGSLAKDVLVERNVFFDGPRAAVVYNDLYGNGLVTRENVMFNMVRITLDHGPYNVWDRQRWLQPPGFKDKANVVERNLLLGTTGGDKVVDLDDAARDHIIRDNVVAYGAIKLKGHNATAFDNIIVAYLATQNRCFDLCNADYKVARYRAFDNVCYGSGGKVPYAWQHGVRKRCKNNFIRADSNRFHGVASKFAFCGNLRKWRRRFGHDRKSTFNKAAVAPDVIASACWDLLATFGL